MLNRRPLKPDNRSLNKLRKSLVSGASKAKFPEANERPSIFTWARAGRQNSEGFGGGNRVKGIKRH